MIAIPLRVRYSCTVCAIRLREISVPSRDPHDDVGAWLETVMLYVAADHRVYSPDCRGQRVDLTIPVAKNGDAIGTPAKH